MSNEGYHEPINELSDETKYVAWDISETKQAGPSKEQSLLDVELKNFRTQLVGKKSQKTKIYTGWIKAKSTEA
mgnify:CR=1 FL=1